MKYFIYFIISSFLIISLVVVANLPLRIIKPVMAEYFPEITFSKIDGTVWSGKIYDLSFANEYLGNLNTEMDLRTLEFYLDDNDVLVKGILNIICSITKDCLKLIFLND